MGQLFTIRNPRGVTADAVNECANPSVDVDTTGYVDDHYFGADGAGTWGRITSQYSYLPGRPMLERRWTTASRAFTPVVGAGHIYQTGWSGGQQKTVSWNAAVVGHSCNLIMRVEFTDAVGKILGQYDTPQRFSSGGWVSFTNTVTAPGGTWYANVRVMMVDGVAPVGAAMWAQALQITSTPAALPYFDGYSAPSGINTYGWVGTAGKSASYRYIPDPRSDVRPYLIMNGYDTNRQSRNTVHQFLSGAVGATILPSSLRSGVLRLYFDDPAKAATAEAQHAVAGTWAFADDDNPAEGMTYVVDGAVRSYQDETRLCRVVEVPYREVTA